MPLHRKDETGKFVPFERTAFPDLERVLEDWIEANPHLLLDGESVAIIARQPRSTFGKYLDLLALDESGACVVVELKRGETPRDVVAQTLEYAAWVASRSHDQLDALAREYATRRGTAVDGIEDLYRSIFAAEPNDEAPSELSDRITFNNRQRMIVVAESFSGEVERTLRYLRTRLGVDITGLQFAVHVAGGETLIETNLVVGRERPSAAAERTPVAREPESQESILARAKTEFMLHAVTAIDAWVTQVGNPELEVRHGPGRKHFIRFRGRKLLEYRFRIKWITCYLDATPSEVALLRRDLSDPSDVRENRGYATFVVANDADFRVLQNLVLSRIAGGGLER